MTHPDAHEDGRGRLLGTPLRPNTPGPIPYVDKNTPGYGWRLSDQARRQIEAIEENARWTMWRMERGDLG